MIGQTPQVCPPKLKSEPFKPLKKVPDPRTSSAKINGPKLGPNPEKNELQMIPHSKILN